MDVLLYREVLLSDRDRMRRMWRGLARHQVAADPRLNLADDFLQRWEADFEPWVRSPVHRLYVAQEGIDASRLVGFVHARLHEHAPVFEGPPEVFVEAIWVDEGARKRGAARALVQCVRDWAVEVEAQRIRYSVLARDETATSFWVRMGGTPLITYGTIDVSPESAPRLAQATESLPTIGFSVDSGAPDPGPKRGNRGDL